MEQIEKINISSIAQKVIIKKDNSFHQAFYDEKEELLWIDGESFSVKNKTPDSHKEKNYTTAGISSKNYAENNNKIVHNTNKHLESKSMTMLSSPLSGRVISLNCTLGSIIKTGQQLLVIESMKMENCINAAQPGIIKTIFIQSGDVVKQGQLLIEISKEGAEHV